MAMGAAFEVAVRKIMTAFEERARLISSHKNV
jgi:ribosome-associated toxin RatA of RatAB toxin-antitoxin module